MRCGGSGGGGIRSRPRLGGRLRRGARAAAAGSRGDRARCSVITIRPNQSRCRLSPLSLSVCTRSRHAPDVRIVVIVVFVVVRLRWCGARRVAAAVLPVGQPDVGRPADRRQVWQDRVGHRWDFRGHQRVLRLRGIPRAGSDLRLCGLRVCRSRFDGPRRGCSARMGRRRNREWTFAGECQALNPMRDERGVK